MVKSKSLIKYNVCMKFYNETKPLYLETDVSRIGPGAALKYRLEMVQYAQGIQHETTSILRSITFSIKSLTNAE